MSVFVNKSSNKSIAVGILGMGEVGSSINKLYQLNETELFSVSTKDKGEQFKHKRLDVLNVCIPYTESFIETIKQEIQLTSPALTIVHSTVPVGTTRKIDLELKENYNIVHSPIRGNHPDLTKSLTTFVKYIGSSNPKATKLAVEHLRQLNIDIIACNSYEKTELAKLLCTTYYGICIMWHNEMKKVCDNYGVNFDVVTSWNQTYNKGYSQLGLDKYVRPVLTPPDNNKIGGHCVIPNAELLNDILNSKLIEELIKYK